MASACACLCYQDPLLPCGLGSESATRYGWARVFAGRNTLSNRKWGFGLLDCVLERTGRCTAQKRHRALKERLIKCCVVISQASFETTRQRIISKTTDNSKHCLIYHLFIYIYISSYTCILYGSGCAPVAAPIRVCLCCACACLRVNPQGSACEDWTTVFCCYPLAVCQMIREMKRRMKTQTYHVSTALECSWRRSQPFTVEKTLVGVNWDPTAQRISAVKAWSCFKFTPRVPLTMNWACPKILYRTNFEL